MSASNESHLRSIFPARFWSVGLPLLLAVVTFAVYLPSLKSDFVYDARLEILEEGFITVPGYLPDVLTLKVLGMKLMLGDRPGQLLYLMVIAVVCGKEPFGYHLCSNFLHAANVALLFILLRRLIAAELGDLTGNGAWKAHLAAGVATLVFAFHPIAVESVSEVSYSSSLLVTLFTLLALLAATAFRPENIRSAIRMGSAGAICALAAVMSKESGLTAVLVLVAYWYLFRRSEARRPWLLFLGAAIAVTMLFLAARFLFAPSTHVHFHYLGDSFGQVWLIQPHLWVFMMGKLFWPIHLSADYTPENSNWLPAFLAMAVLALVFLLQSWLWERSRIGALGVALYWLGLVTVSNFIPLYHAVADRYYYLPLAGLALQLLALLLMTLKSRAAFWTAMVALLVAILPLTWLTLDREKVFAGENSLWSDTLQVSPFSSIAHNNLGILLDQMGKTDEAMAHYQKALEISPNDVDAYNNLGVAFHRMGKEDEAVAQYQKALEISPDDAKTNNNLGFALDQMGRVDEAMVYFRKALETMPHYAQAHLNLGKALLKKGRADEAIVQFKEVLRLNPDDSDAQNNLAQAEVLAPPAHQ